MKPRTVRRLCLVDGMNLDHIEGWLESMAARGLHYDHSDAFLFPVSYTHLTLPTICSV